MPLFQYESLHGVIEHAGLYSALHMISVVLMGVILFCLASHILFRLNTCFNFIYWG